MKVLVTGAGGYIGRYVVKNLLDQGADVTALDFKFDGIDDRAQKITFDIFKPCDNMFEQLGSPDVMIHMAWMKGFMHNAPEHMQYLSSHYNFVMDMVEKGLKRVVVMGSMHEVGYHEGVVLEDTPTNPRSLYAISKDALRRSLTLSLENTDAKLQWVRAFYILGDDEKNSSVFTKLIEAEKQGKEKFPFTTGTNKYDFISVEDLGFQISKVAMQDEVCGVINCCSGEPKMLKEVVMEYIKQHNFNIELEYGVFPDRPYDSPIIYGDATKIQKIIMG